MPSRGREMRVEKWSDRNGNEYHNYVYSKQKCKKCLLKAPSKVGRRKTYIYRPGKSGEP